MERFPIEKDPRFQKLLNHYVWKVELHKKAETSRFGILLSVVTAPFFTVAASMQMSVKAHENLYGKPGFDQPNYKELAERSLGLKKISSDEKSVMKVSEENKVKVYKSERVQKLHKMTGQVGTNAPYRAPIYMSYRECITGLYRQGILGFYKGNMYRQAYFLFSGMTQVEIAFKI